MLSRCTKEVLYTKQGTYNFRALEETELVDDQLLLYFCKINSAQERLSMNYRDPSFSSSVPNSDKDKIDSISLPLWKEGTFDSLALDYHCV